MRKNGKKLTAVLLSMMLCLPMVPLATTTVDAAVSKTAVYVQDVDDDEIFDEEDEDYYDDDAFDAIALSLEDITVTPAKVTLKKGKSVYINIVSNSDEFEDLPDEEWDELVDLSLDSITYRSTKSSVASVNKKGKIVARKSGSAIIKTTVVLSDGSERTYKTKVYVSK